MLRLVSDAAQIGLEVFDPAFKLLLLWIFGPLQDAENVFFFFYAPFSLFSEESILSVNFCFMSTRHSSRAENLDSWYMFIVEILALKFPQ